MAKQYKYIGQDPQKKGWIAKQCMEGLYVADGRSMTNLMVENEPTIWEEIKEEDVFEKAYNEYLLMPGGDDVEDLKKAFKKHLGITKENVHKELIIHMGITNRSDHIDHIRKLLEDRGLLID